MQVRTAFKALTAISSCTYCSHLSRPTYAQSCSQLASLAVAPAAVLAAVSCANALTTDLQQLPNACTRNRSPLQLPLLCAAAAAAAGCCRHVMAVQAVSDLSSCLLWERGPAALAVCTWLPSSYRSCMQSCCLCWQSADTQVLVNFPCSELDP
jgi:hypothetical protein